MFLWYAVLAATGVALVFRDPRLDHRLVAVGAVLPIPLDVLVGVARGRAGDAGPFHALVVHVLLLVVVMAASIGRRARRKKLLALVIGGFAHLVLDASFVDNAAFVWPFAGGPGGRLRVLERGLAVDVVLEVIGVAVLLWVIDRAGLRDGAVRRALLERGQLEIVPRPRRGRL